MSKNIQILSQGAEAIIYLDKKNNLIIKDRISKDYRIKQIDEKLRKKRTKSEKKILDKIKSLINVPEVYDSKELNKINMEFIKGEKLSETLDNYSLNKQKQICKDIGKEIAKIHEKNIIHGDLTTSNMILEKKESFDKRELNSSAISRRQRENCSISAEKRGFDKGKLGSLYFIDFGLSFQNGKYEDKAVDLHLFKQALEAKHFKKWEELYKEFQKGYTSINKKEAEKVFNQLRKVEKRGRYKH